MWVTAGAHTQAWGAWQRVRPTMIQPHTLTRVCSREVGLVPKWPHRTHGAHSARGVPQARTQMLDPESSWPAREAPGQAGRGWLLPSQGLPGREARGQVSTGLTHDPLRLGGAILAWQQGTVSSCRWLLQGQHSLPCPAPNPSLLGPDTGSCSNSQVKRSGDEQKADPGPQMVVV